MDNLTRAQRSLCMSRVRNASTDLEVLLRRELRRRGHRFTLHRKDLAGTPDIVFTSAKVAIFVNGDFWYGYGYSRSAHQLSPFWRKQIELIGRRDQRNTRKLRRAGWRVVTVWPHQLKRDLDACVGRVVQNLADTPRPARRARSNSGQPARPPT